MLFGLAVHFAGYRQGRGKWNREMELVFAVDFGSMAVVDSTVLVALIWKAD